MKKILHSFLKKYCWVIIVNICFIFLNIYLLTFPAKIIGNIVDLLYDIVGNKNEIIRNTIFLLLMSILLLIVRIPWRFLISYLQRLLEKVLKSELFEHFLKLQMNKIQDLKNGEIMSYLTKDVNEIRKAFYGINSYGGRIIATFIIGIFSMVQGINLKLTIVTILPILITGLLIIKIKPHVEESLKKSQKCFTELSEFIQENTDAIRTIKAYSQETIKISEFKDKNKKLMLANNSVDINSNLLTLCINIGFGIAYGISILYGAYLTLKNQISVGEFITFNGYIGLFIDPISWIPITISKFKSGQTSYRRLDKFLNLGIERVEETNYEDEIVLNGDIKISNLTFYYPNNIERVLSNINLEIPEKSTLGIIGTIGSGKTTLMNLILRLYTISDGKIFIGDKDINEIPLNVIRKNICYITQDNFLFSDTIERNISLFNKEYAEDEITESVKDAMIYDEINSMNNGIQTVIGEKGIDLSGGQKQRIAISRAFLNKANYVIFDDTFSAIDNKTEKEILKNMKKIIKDKTCIIISNKISDIKYADKIIILEDGKILEEGTHKKLIQKKGYYYKFYENQLAETKINQRSID